MTTTTNAPAPREVDGWVGRHVWYLLSGTVLLSLALGFYHLGSKSLWNDEGLSAMVSSGSWSSIVSWGDHADANARTPAMVGYHLLLNVWRSLGADEATLRSLSVIATAATVVAVFLVASRLYGQTIGLIAGFLLAVAPFAVRYAQEVRSYALLMLLVTLGSYCFVRAVETSDARWWGIYAVAAAASCYSHIFAALVILAQASSLVFLPKRSVAVKQLLATAAAISVLLLPLGYLLTAAPQSGAGSRPTASSAFSVISNVAGGKLLLVLFAGLCIVPAVVAWRTWRTVGRSFEVWRVAFALTWLVVPYVVALASAVLLRPLWSPRYLIVILPALVIAGAFAIGQVRDRRLVLVLLVVVAVLAGFKITNWYDAPAHEDWRSAVAYVTRSSTPADGIVFCIPSVRAPFEYYALRHAAGERPRPLSPAAPWSSGLHATPAPASAVPAWRSAPDRIWVVSRYASAGDTGACDLSKSMQGRKPSTSRDVGNVLVERYDLS